MKPTPEQLTKCMEALSFDEEGKKISASSTTKTSGKKDKEFPDDL